MVVMTSFSPPTEGVRHLEPNTTVVVNNREIGKGTVYVSESNFSWVNPSTGVGFCLEYVHIALHAVSRDLETYPKECLYVMVDKKLEDDDNGSSDEESDEDGDSNTGMTEMRFIPDDSSSLDGLFAAMNHCQSLHPDPVQSVSEDDEGIDEEEEGGGDSTDQHIGALRNGVSNGMNGDSSPMETDGQFDDAES